MFSGRDAKFERKLDPITGDVRCGIVVRLGARGVIVPEVATLVTLALASGNDFSAYEDGGDVRNL